MPYHNISNTVFASIMITLTLQYWLRWKLALDFIELMITAGDDIERETKWKPVFCQNISFDTVNLFLCDFTHLSEICQMLIFLKFCHFWVPIKSTMCCKCILWITCNLYEGGKKDKPIDFQLKTSDSSNCTILPSRRISMPSSTM